MKKQKAPAPKEHWEIKYTPTNATGNKMMDAFLPKSGKDRPVPHKKINEYDH